MKKRSKSVKKKKKGTSSSAASKKNDVPVEIAQMSALVKTFQKITNELNLSDDMTSGSILRHFRHELAEDPTDQHKHMIIQESLSPLVCLAVARTFQQQPYDRIRSFRVLNANLRDEGVMHLATGLRYLKRVNRVDFTQCLMSGAGAGVLGAELGRSGANHIVHVHCDHNPLLGDDGVRQLVDGGLCRHRTLQTLNLSFCALGEHGGMIIGQLLSHCRTIKTLYLQGNALGNQGIRDLATHGIANHPTLQYIDISQTSFGDDANTVHTLMQAVESAPALHTLKMDGNVICNDGMQMILSVVERQRELGVGGGGAHLHTMKLPLTANSAVFAAIMTNLRALAPKKKKKRRGGKKKKTLKKK